MGWTLAEAETGHNREALVAYLRNCDPPYPRPEDCAKDCEFSRPACRVGVCFLAVKFCGDF